MNSSIKEALESLVVQMESPPSWDQIADQKLDRTRYRKRIGRPLIAAIVAFATVLLAAVGAGILVNQPRSVAASIDHVRLHWTSSPDLRCQGLRAVDNGGFTTAEIDIWGPSSDRKYRVDATAPDGTVERTVIELDEDGLAIREWSSYEVFEFDNRTVFKVAGCIDDVAGASFGLTSPPGRSELMPQEFVNLTGDAAWLTSSKPQREAEWRGLPVTVLASSSASDGGELGRYSVSREFWVDFPRNRLERLVGEFDWEIIGRSDFVIEVTDRFVEAEGDVSFATDNLFLSFDLEGTTETVGVVTTTAPGESLMANAHPIEYGEVPTVELRQVMAYEVGDQLFRLPVQEYEVVVRLRAGARPHIYATSCDVLNLVDLPEGWEGTCLERTVDGQRQTGVFPYGTASE